MKKIITFLGAIPARRINATGVLEPPTKYSYKNANGEIEEYSGYVFAEALSQFCDYEAMLVCVTDKAKQANWSILEELKDPKIQAVDIPTGNNTAEMWKIFKIITEHINEKDIVIFDITHGLRSLSFLVFLFAAYLKASKQVTIEHIYYGALELRQENNGLAPVIDLSEFVSMIDWITASNQFVQTGDARQLANLLNPDDSTTGVNKKAADTLFNVSLATLLCRPLELGIEAETLEDELLKSQQQQPNKVIPFEMVRQKVTNTFDSFIGNLYRDELTALQAQFRLIKWYHNNNRLIEAMTLAREWLLSAVSYRLEQQVLLDKRSRDDINKALFDIDDRRPPRDLTVYGKKIHTWNDKRELIAVWNAVRTVRNTLDHAGYERAPMSVTEIVKESKKALEKLSKLAKSWDLADD